MTSVTPDVITTPAETVYIPLWRVRLRLFLRGLRANWALFAENPIGLLGIGVIFFFGLLALAHPILIKTVWPRSVYDPVNGFDLETPVSPAPPSARHLLGTDPLGRDVLSQLMYSTASEFALGIVAAIVTVTIATTIGAISAYYGGLIDTFFMRLADLIIILPGLPILIVMGALFNLELIHLALIFGVLSGFGGTTLIIKAQALTIKVKPFIEAARIAGGSDWHIIFTHMVPNLMPLAFLYMMFTVTSAIFSDCSSSSSSWAFSVISRIISIDCTTAPFRSNNGEAEISNFRFPVLLLKVCTVWANFR